MAGSCRRTILVEVCVTDVLPPPGLGMQSVRAHNSSIGESMRQVGVECEDDQSECDAREHQRTQARQRNPGGTGRASMGGRAKIGAAAEPLAQCRTHWSQYPVGQLMPHMSKYTFIVPTSPNRRCETQTQPSSNSVGATIHQTT